jgi:MFS family permease
MTGGPAAKGDSQRSAANQAGGVGAVLAGVRRSARSGPLAVRNFRLLTGGQFASTVGDFCYAVALAVVVLSSHGGAVLLGTVLACYGVPRTVLIPVGGVLADKVGPRTLMLAADTVRCVLVAGLAVLAARHTASLVALGPIAAVIGAGEGLFIPASFAIMPSLLDGERLTAGNALSSAAVQAGSLLGPALGGTLVAVTRSSTAAFAVDAVSFAVSALTLLLIPRRAAEVSDPEGSEVSGAAGSKGGALALLRRSRALQVILVVVIAANLASGGIGEVALPSLAHAKFGAAGYGALLACLAAGGVLGTLAAGRCGRLRRPALLGRVMSAIMLCAFGSFPLSVAITGLLVHRLGPALFFPIAGSLVAVAVLGGLTQREFRDFGNLGTAATSPVPASRG